MTHSINFDDDKLDIDSCYNTINVLQEANTKHIKTLMNKTVCLIDTIKEICNVYRGDPLQIPQNGKYDVISGVGKIGTHTVPNRFIGDDVIISADGILYKLAPYYLLDNCIAVQSKVKYLNNEFLYYLLKYEDKYLKNIDDLNCIKNIEIYIPPLNVQNDIIKYCKNNEETINKLKKFIDENENMYDVLTRAIKKFVNNIVI